MKKATLKPKSSYLMGADESARQASSNDTTLDHQLDTHRFVIPVALSELQDKLSVNLVK